MIDFRYHLVSLIAVFLAVALGIVIGTTQLNGPVLSNLEAQVSALQEDKRQLEDETQQLQATVDDAGAFDEAVGPTLVRDTLAGRSVVLVVGSADVPTDVVEGVTALLGSAGATVTGNLRLTGAFSDPGTASALQTYVTGPGLPPGVVLPETDDTGELVAALLADVLMVPVGGTPPDAAATSSVLSGLEELEVLSRDTTSISPADFAVFLTAGGYTVDEGAVERNGALTDLVTALDAGGSGAVLAGDPASAAEGGLVAAIRADAGVTSRVSTVDDAHTPAGRITTVLAVAAEGRGTSGEYGTGEDSLPVPAPAP
ncbi:MAG TPA: copper transporter [Modestobacter sp.]|nr:copper transporter [Modestobacter sp.]